MATIYVVRACTTHVFAAVGILEVHGAPHEGQAAAVRPPTLAGALFELGRL